MISQTLLEGFLTQAKDHALVLLDPEGRIVSWAAGAENVFGYVAQEVRDKHFSILFTPEDLDNGSPEHELAVAADYGKSEDDRWMLRKDAGRFWASGTVTAIRAEDQSLLGFAKLLRDRTDVRTMLQNLQNRLDAAEQQVKRKDEMVAAFAHELRTPLTALSFGLEILRRAGLPEGAPAESIAMMARQSDFMSSVIRNLLDLTRLQTGKTLVTVEKIPLSQLVQRALETCQAILRERRHEPRVILPASEITIEGDPGLMQQVLVNLLTNAAKFCESPMPIWIMATVEGHEAVVRVRDHGCGIKGEMLPHIFEMFTQVGPDTRGAGLGIGLAVVKQLVELHGGTITVRSEGEGLGSEFTFRVPLTQAARTPDSDRSN